MLATGPSALAVAPDGTFWIADTVANRLVQYSTNCQLLAVISLDGIAVGVSDIVADASSLWALDVAAVAPTVLHLGQKGGLLERYELDPTDIETISGLALTPQGEVLIEYEGVAFYARLVDVEGNQVSGRLTGLPTEMGEYRAVPSADTSKGGGYGMVVVGDHAANVSTQNLLGGLYVLAVAPDDTTYVVAEEVVIGETIQVDQTIRHYDATARLLGVARVPLTENYTYVAHAIAVGPDSVAYALVTRADGAEIQRLVFVAPDEFEPILPQPSFSQPADIPSEEMMPGSEQNDSPEGISPTTIINNAWNYLNNSKYLSSTNTDGACTGRAKPLYLGGAGTYPSVSYDWGGFDSVSAFNGYMSPGTMQAGDRNTSSETCSRGVDCSGFVSRAWGLSSKYSTSTLPSISIPLGSTGKLRRGDILNSTAAGHVVLFSHHAVGGIVDFEATTWNNNDRVIRVFSSWSRLSGYSPLRYNQASTDSCSGQYRTEYYNNISLSGMPNYTVCEGWPINHNWGNGGPAGIGIDNFSARWVGEASFSSGTYTFVALSDDGVRVWFDGSLIINGWVDQGPTEYRHTRTVSAGVHQVQIDYYEHGGGAIIQFYWESAGGGSCSPGTNQVALYVDSNYAGQCVVKGLGNYSNPGAIGLPNDSISSIKIGSGAKAVLCEHDNYGGTCETFTTSDSNLGDNAIGNDRVSSALVQLSGGSGNLALNRPAWATSQQGSGYEPYRGNDGNLGTRWSSQVSSTDEWWWVDLGTQTFDRVTVRWEAAYAAYYFIGWSNDAINFTGYWYTRSTGGTYNHDIGTRTARYVGILMRTHAPGLGNYSFWELEVYRLLGSGPEPVEPIDLQSRPIETVNRRFP